ncbi:multiubiquitin domain-containing protein [Actinoallomurus soli]|uniref:multiubiquitin domain-containing protein n=1 Tax=Actinoallomurus soli TaxID=2952535 RepID=UPI002091E8A8|nr:multiubiquitin domain-containing protein [Actinoallomurus soli]MCO5974826.1 multiubiquitin domain-containing protein [Actinoallomurus soli]
MAQDDHGHKPVTIIINSRPYQWEDKDISFEQLVVLAFPDRPPTEQDTFTVRYTRGPEGHGAGSLTAGHSVHVKEGMVFDVERTSRS